MKTFCLLNPSRNQNKWRDLFASLGLPRGVVNRELSDGLERMVQSGLQTGVEKFIVVGGDGTFNRVVNALAKLHALDRVLELVPGGTCNDFSRYLQGKGFHWKLGQAQNIHLVDLAILNGRYFLNNAGFGRSPKASKRNAWRSALNFEPVALQARWAAGQISGTFWMAMACNAPFFNKGLYFSKDVNAADSILNFYFLRPQTRWKTLQTLIKGRLGLPLISATDTARFGVSGPIVSTKSHELVIETDPAVWPQWDGEPLSQPTKMLKFEIAREQLKIAVP